MAPLADLAVLELSRVELDERRCVHRERNIGLHRSSDHATPELVRRIHRDVARQATLRATLDRFHDRHALAGLAGRDRHFVTGLREVTRPIDLLAVHPDVAVRNELARCRNRRRETHAEDDVVQATLEDSQKIVTRAARKLACAREVPTQLAFAHAVVEANLLLLLQQATKLAGLPALGLRLPVLAGRMGLLR